MFADLKRGVVRARISELERQLECVLKSVLLVGTNNLCSLGWDGIGWDAMGTCLCLTSAWPKLISQVNGKTSINPSVAGEWLGS